MTKPIFIVGRHRSGTTWLTNLLASHPQIYTPQHPEHYGQHESAYFSSLLPYCNWGRTECDRRAAQAIFERSDFWHLLFPNEPPTIDIEEFGFDRYLEQAMAEACRRRKATHWIEKTPSNTLLLSYLTRAFGDAVFIAVERNTLDTVRSNVYKFGNPRNPVDWAKAAAWTGLYRRITDGFRDHVYRVKYEDLVNDTKRQLSRIIMHIGLSDEWGDYGDWQTNSSYERDPPRIPVGMSITALVTTSVFNLLPRSVCQGLATLLLEQRARRLPKWFFRVYRGRSRIVHE